VDLIIGTYTERLPHVTGKADGILSASFDPVSGRIGPVATLAAARNPTYLALSASGEHLYAANETHTFDGQPGGGITAYARDPRTGQLTRLNGGPSIGEAPCHIALDRTGRFAATANYGVGAGSVTVYRLEPDGSLGERTDHVRPAGSGPNPVRQAAAHAHMIATDPVTGEVLVADLGADSVLAYALDSAGRLAPRGAVHRAVPGAGPRHLAFHPGGRHLFVVNELASTVTALSRQNDGGFTVTDQVPTRPAGVSGQNLAAAIRVTPSGRHVLVSNRGHDSLTVLRFDPAAASLSLVGSTPSAGAFPRDFILTRDGRHVILASQDSDLLASYEFDDETGALRLRHTAAALTPVCLVLA
jgi:6-phosphogluconolactonase